MIHKKTQFPNAFLIFFISKNIHKTATRMKNKIKLLKSLKMQL